MSRIRAESVPASVSAAALTTAAIAPEGTAREIALVTAVVSGCLWLVARGLTERRSVVSAQVALGVAMLALVGLPAIILLADPTLYVGATLDSLTPSLSLWALGIHAIVAGGLLASRWPARWRALPQRRVRAHEMVPAARKLWVAAYVLSFGALLAFLEAAGGASEYLQNLDETGGRTQGLTYLIWGLLVAKFAALSLVGARWQSRRSAGVGGWAALAIGLIFVALVGSRLLLLVAIAQIVLLALVVRPPGRRVAIGVVIALAVVPVVAVGLGELRRWQSTDRSIAFPRYFVDVGLPALPRTLVNQYADGIRLAAMARDVVPESAPYEYGKELLRVAVHPIPSRLRPEIARDRAVLQAFTSGGGSGNALPVPVVGHLQGGALGVLLFSFAFGLAVGLVDRGLSSRPSPAAQLALIGAVTGSVIVFRGSLAQAFALAAIDVIGLYVTARVLLRPTTNPSPRTAA